jgi:hypothetical protein
MEQLNLLVSTLNLSNSAVECKSELGGPNQGERIKTMPQKAKLGSYHDDGDSE